MRILLAIVALTIMATKPAAAVESDYLDWASLVDVSAQDFKDPFRDLDPDTLGDLVRYARLQARLEAADMDDATSDELYTRIAETRETLENAGIDIEWLLSQRWEVAERRRTAALAVNPDLDGKEVEIGGFVVPAPPMEDGTPTAYLVPERGMCAHIPPPPPNQLLRIVASELPEFQRIHEPVIVRGRLTAVETNREVFVVDGPVPMWSAWTIDNASLEIFKPKADE
ncbi:DUF3299 domain-containing protein [Ruegeria profundi]|uniref:DUF3299 domain-containing protein n=1 Tax=Ruegeria profundi TaxID=1685378 RepID=A0A0X3TRJ7_9RHOB|nr:DUF3299 domain-containing protein [Ruegeria profundi]KUJ77086.1 hypothetical protein AVO44_18760 [Ruegeria profundi]